MSSTIGTGVYCVRRKFGGLFTSAVMLAYLRSRRPYVLRARPTSNKCYYEHSTPASGLSQTLQRSRKSTRTPRDLVPHYEPSPAKVAHERLSFNAAPQHGITATQQSNQLLRFHSEQSGVPVARPTHLPHKERSGIPRPVFTLVFTGTKPALRRNTACNLARHTAVGQHVSYLLAPRIFIRLFV